jgi:predicted transcriptional regulator
MPRKVSVFRLDPDAQTALAHLSKLEGRPMNKLVNEAIRDYLLKTSERERELETTLATLREYRESESVAAEKRDL